MASMDSSQRAFIVGCTAGATAVVALYMAYDRFIRQRVGEFSNPRWGRPSVCAAQDGPEQPRRNNSSPAALHANAQPAPTAKQALVVERWKKTLQHRATLKEMATMPKEFYKKHPKGCGVDLVVTGVKIDEVLLLPVPHLGQFYEGEKESNSLGSGTHHDYSQFTSSEDVR